MDGRNIMAVGHDCVNDTTVLPELGSVADPIQNLQVMELIGFLQGMTDAAVSLAIM